MNRDHFDQQEHEAEQSRTDDKIELAERMKEAPPASEFEQWWLENHRRFTDKWSAANAAWYASEEAYIKKIATNVKDLTS